MRAKDDRSGRRALALALVCAGSLALLGSCSNGGPGRDGTTLEAGIFAVPASVGAWSGAGALVVVIDKDAVYEPDGFDCTVSGADRIELPSTRLFRMDPSSGQVSELELDGAFDVWAVVDVPALGGGVALRGRGDRHVLALHDGSIGFGYPQLDVFDGDERRSFLDAAADLGGDVWRVVYVDDLGTLRTFDDERGVRTLASPGTGARILSIDESRVAIGMVTGSRFVVERRSLDDGSLIGTAVEMTLPSEGFPAPPASGANGTPEDLRVALDDPDRDDSAIVLRLEGDEIRQEARVPRFTGFETRLGSVELLFTQSPLEAHLLDESGMLHAITATDSEGLCEGRTTEWPCGGTSCQARYNFALDGEGGVRLVRYLGWWPTSHTLAILPTEMRPADLPPDAGLAQVRFIALGTDDEFDVWVLDPDATSYRMLFPLPYRMLSEHVSLPRGGGVEREGIRIGIGLSGWPDYRFALPDTTERATVVYWNEHGGDMHHRAWEEAPPASPGSIGWSTLAWLGGFRPHDATWSIRSTLCTGAACEPGPCRALFDDGRSEGDVVSEEAIVLAPDQTLEVEAFLGPDGACGGAARGAHTLTPADAGRSYLTVLDGLRTDDPRVVWIASGGD